MLLGFACFALACLAQGTFKPPEITSVTDAYRPYLIITDGFVVLDAALDANGNITGVTSLRNPGAITPVAIEAVKQWEFRPATAPSGPRASDMIVVFVYRPTAVLPAATAPPADFKPVLPAPQPDSANPDYAPPGIISVVYPQYPFMSASQGSVIVQMTIGVAGNARDIKVLHDMGPGPFTPFSLDALKKWRFQAATLNGKSVPATLAVAFIFQRPPTTN